MFSGSQLWLKGNILDPEHKHARGLLHCERNDMEVRTIFWSPQSKHLARSVALTYRGLWGFLCTWSHNGSFYGNLGRAAKGLTAFRKQNVNALSMSVVAFYCVSLKLLCVCKNYRQLWNRRYQYLTQEFLCKIYFVWFENVINKKCFYCVKILLEKVWNSNLQATKILEKDNHWLARKIECYLSSTLQ